MDLNACKETVDQQQEQEDQQTKAHDECEEGVITREENDRHDTSQIHIKYAKMLEELENESIELEHMEYEEENKEA